MKRTLGKKYEDAIIASESVDKLEHTVTGRTWAVHYPEMVDGFINKRNRKLLRRKIRSVGITKQQGNKMGES
jgi:hypothetical protein